MDPSKPRLKPISRPVPETLTRSHGNFEIAWPVFFGYVKNTCFGASGNKTGLVAAVEKRTLFSVEIGDIPIAD